MGHKTRLRPAHNERKRKSFESRYGMTREQWRELKRSDPTTADELRKKNVTK